MNKEEVKTYIERSIESLQFKEAKGLIKQYNDIYGFDADIASMQSVIEVYNENYDEAIKYIIKGLEINMFSCDLYINLANVYELMGEYDKAIICYEQANILCDDIDKFQYIQNKYNYLYDNYIINVKKVSVLILANNNMDNINFSIYNLYKFCDFQEIILTHNFDDADINKIKNKDERLILLKNKNKNDLSEIIHNGISLCNKDNDIFILDANNTVLMNTLFNLRMAAYSSESIGLVEASSNVDRFNNKYINIDRYIDYVVRQSIFSINNFKRKKMIDISRCYIKHSVIKNIEIVNKGFFIKQYLEFDLSSKTLMKNFINIKCDNSFVYESVQKDIRDSDYDFYINKTEVTFKELYGFGLLNGIKYKDKIVSMLMNYDKVLFVGNDFEYIFMCSELNEKTIFSTKKISGIDNVNYFEFGKTDISGFNLIFAKNEEKISVDGFEKEFNSEEFVVFRNEKLDVYRCDNVRFSVIIPVHNTANYIQRCLKSVVDQKFKNYEIIVINDSSTDNSKEVITSMGIECLDVNVANAGLARNIGLDIAKGEYVIFLDSDDYFLNDYVFNILNDYILDEDIIHFGFNFGSDPVKGNSEFFPNVWSRVWKRSYIGDTRFLKIAYGEDARFIEDLYSQKFSTEKVLKECLVQYRYPREGSLTNQHEKQLKSEKNTDD